MVEELHSIAHLSKQGKLVFYVNYSLGVSTYDLHWLSSEQIGFLWRAFAPTDFHARRWERKSKLVKKRIKVTGYPKLDSLYSTSKNESLRKRIVLAPHHSIDNSDSEWSLGDFLELFHIYAKIPELFPQIDFNFRPHPLLKSKLEDENIWGKDLTSEYFNALTNLPNVTLSEESNYLELFVQSDALIHNSGSFLAEYLYTGQPAAFLITNKKLLLKSLHRFGRMCLRKHYLLYEIEDVIKFINEVVLNENDSKKRKRIKFARRKLQEDRVSASQKIINELETVLVI
jgi:CDP-glycerol glycerophosphotransferase (TagB/SpsB family)